MENNNGWISVNERLPDLDVRVLCFWPDQHQESATLERHNGEIWHCLDNGEMLSKNPTHWTPLIPMPEVR